MRGSQLRINELALSGAAALFKRPVCEPRDNQQSEKCAGNIQQDVAN